MEYFTFVEFDEVLVIGSGNVELPIYLNLELAVAVS